MIWRNDIRPCTIIRLQLCIKCVWCFCCHSVCWILHDLWSLDCFLPLLWLDCWFQIEKCKVAKAMATLCFSLLYTISYNLRPQSWLGSTLKCQIDFFIGLKGQPSTVERLVNRERFVQTLQKKMVYKDDFTGLHGHSELQRSTEESLYISRHLKTFDLMQVKLCSCPCPVQTVL